MALALLLLPLLTFAEECPIYTCGELKGELCISQGVNFNITVQSCNETAICQPTQQTDSYCVTEMPPVKYPGDYCYNDDDCISDNCTSFICQGLGKSANCTNVYDCNPGLQCDPETLTCEPQLTSGQPCVTDYQCLNNMLCNLGVCTPYLSVANGSPVVRLDNAFTGLSLACASGFATGTEGAYQCAVAPKAKGPLPVFCDAGSTCSDSTGKYTVPCQCGVNSEADAYCALFPGDAPVLTALQNMQIILSENTECNTYSRFSFNCFAAQGPSDMQHYYNFAGNYSLIMGNTYAMVTGSDECLQEVYASDYYYQTQALASYSQSHCPVYECATTVQDWEAGQCWLLDRVTADYVVQDFVSTQPCPNGEICPGNQYNATCQLNTGNRYPGDPCSSSAPCTVGTCTNSVCVYKGMNDPCEFVYDCGSGLVCNMTSQLCQAQVGQGGYCDDVYECANALTCSLSKCIPYYSLGIGNVTDRFYENGYSEACASGYVSLSTGTQGICAVPPTSPSMVLAPCTPGSTCLSSTNTAKECVCGLNAANEAFCPYFEGDSPLQNAILSYATVAQLAGNTTCNTFSRNSYLCFEASSVDISSVFYYAINMTTYQIGHLMKSAEHCVAAGYASTAQLILLQDLYKNYTPPTPPGPGSSGLILTGALAVLTSLVL